jgi:hypothetical protein
MNILIYYVFFCNKILKNTYYKHTVLQNNIISAKIKQMFVYEYGLDNIADFI